MQLIASDFCLGTSMRLLFYVSLFTAVHFFWLVLKPKEMAETHSINNKDNQTSLRSCPAVRVYVCNTGLGIELVNLTLTV
jgi:hypothetical protein